MFIRQKRVNGTQYRAVVENYRDGGKVRQRVIVSLGQCATLDGAIQNEQVWVEFWRASVKRYGNAGNSQRMVFN